MHWLTYLYLYGEVTMTISMQNAVPAFTPPEPKVKS